MGAKLSAACKEPYFIMLGLAGRLLSPDGGPGHDEEGALLPTNDTVLLLHYFKEHSEGLKINGISLLPQEIGRSLYIFVTIVTVVLLQVTPMGDDY